MTYYKVQKNPHTMLSSKANRFSDMNIRVSTEELRQVNRTSIPLGNGGGYYGQMGVFHELHCLKFIRQAFHLDEYRNLLGPTEISAMAEHTGASHSLYSGSSG